jgi:GTP-binding protein Era
MFRCGYVAIVGVPNVGKSTLMNALLGEKLSIVTDKPQTTRHRITGILKRPKAQILFLDTPGIHESKKLMNESMVEVALRTLGDADVVLHLIMPKAVVSKEDLEISHKIRETGKPYFVLINKVDRVNKDALLPLIQKVFEQLQPREIVPISALNGDGLERILPLLENHLPEGPALYPMDQYTERDTRFLCAEIVREKATKLLHEELPYALATEVEAYQEGEKLDRINIAILVEKPSQKGIVIGAGGSMLKRIGQFAREDIEKMLGKKVFLELFVKVEPDWTKNQRRLKELGILS